MGNYTRLTTGGTAFSGMLENFAVVTVMNAKVYEIKSTISFNQTARQICAQYLNETPLCTLKTLKVANVTTEGPTKTITGGQYANALLKFGKTARLEMQDALGNAEAVEALCGGLVEYSTKTDEVYSDRIALHNGSDFASPKLIIGDSFFIDKASGKQVKVNIIFYQFNPDSLFNLTQDAEGDATVFDMNGDLLTTDILVGTEDGTLTSHGVFYSVIEDQTGESTGLYSIDSTGKITITTGYTATLDGDSVTSGTTELEEGTAALLVIKKGSDVVLKTIVVR